MQEWTVVSVIVVLVGLGISIIKPIISLNGTITRLADSVGVLEKNIESIAAKNSDAHDKLWLITNRHDDIIREHEFRLQKIEEK
ncbi:MAG: hypothetical protein IKV47_06215 [Oscillospiraceae bacterium]|nr:hypothetical protein [Oscillospiraceae bacterium]MBR5261748.1 hypothetical protein [Oscillospiraceae bacterium]